MTKAYLSQNIGRILEQIDYSKLGNKVGIKVHFGEKGCTTYLNPEIARAVYNKIKTLGKEPSLVECNVLYKGSRTNSTDHIQTAREHGFTNMDIDILDGENGDEFIEMNGCKIGKRIEKYDSMIVLSHFKGHGMAGFGGAIKNIGMGFGSRAGKLDMHSNVKLSINNNCIGCGICIKNCNADAISMINGKAVIDRDKCEGCAMCIAVCPNKAVEVPWEGRTSQNLQKRTAEYAAAVISRLPNMVFINVLQNITPHCDCMESIQQPMMQDVGFLYSTDIVAIDKASLDLANKYSEGKFEGINEIDKDQQIKFAEDLNLGNSQYELVEI